MVRLTTLEDDPLHGLPSRRPRGFNEHPTKRRGYIRLFWPKGQVQVSMNVPQIVLPRPPKGKASTDVLEKVQPQPPKGQASTDVPEIVQPRPPEGQASMDVPEIVQPRPPEGQASTDVPMIVQPRPPEGQASTDVPEEPLPPPKRQASTDVPEIGMEPLPPDFSKWVSDMDAAANKVDIHTEEAAWKQQSTDQVISSTSSHNLIDVFTPQMISFGPFHHGAEHLKKYEEHKCRALAHFLYQAKMRSEPFVSKLRCILQQLQDSYQGLDKKWKKNPYEFLKMMLLDGCFMIEVLRANESSYALNDPVFGLQMKHLYKPYIKRDMLSLENQFPLLVLKALLEVEKCGPIDDVYINNLVLSYCSDYLKANFPKLASHPLKLYRKSMLGEDTIVQFQFKTPIISTTKMIENAVKLRENGVRFRKSQSTSLRNINFNAKTGLLELPVFPVIDETEHMHLLLNLISYEKYNVSVGNEIMSYIKFMYELIHTEDDVKLLQENGIINNSLRSKAIADLFNNSLSKVVVVFPSNDSLSTLRSILSDYYHSKKEKGNFFIRHPGKVLSVFTISLVLSFVQTIYTALSFHLRK